MPPLFVGAAQLRDARQNLRPAPGAKRLVRDAIRGHCAEDVDPVIMEHRLQALLRRDLGQPLYRIEDLARGSFAQKLLEKAFRNLGCQMCLRDSVRIPFGGELRQVLQAAFQHVQRMQYAQSRAIGKLECGRAPLDAIGLQADDAIEEVNLLDAEPFDSLAELRRLRGCFFRRGLPIPPSLRFQDFRELACVLRGADEIGIARHADREFPMPLDAIVLGPKCQGLPADEQRSPIAVMEDEIDLPVGESDLGQGISRQSAVRPARGYGRLADALGAAA